METIELLKMVSLVGLVHNNIICLRKTNLYRLFRYLFAKVEMSFGDNAYDCTDSYWITKWATIGLLNITENVFQFFCIQYDTVGIILQVILNTNF